MQHKKMITPRRPVKINAGDTFLYDNGEKGTIKHVVSKRGPHARVDVELETGETVSESAKDVLACIERNNRDEALIIFIKVFNSILTNKDSDIWQYEDFGAIPPLLISKLEEAGVLVTNKSRIKQQLGRITSGGSLARFSGMLGREDNPRQWAYNEIAPFLKLSRKKGGSIGDEVVTKFSHKRFERTAHIISMFCESIPPKELVENIDTDHTPLQDWVCDNLKEEFNYSTGDAVLNAAIEIPESGALNGRKETPECLEKL